MQKIILLIVLIFSSVVYSQQTTFVDFQNLNGKIKLFPEKKKMSGELHYTFYIKKTVDSIYLNAKKAQAQFLNHSSFKGSLKTTDQHLIIYHPFKANKKYYLHFTYEIENPKQSLYFIGWENSDYPQIWSQGQGKDISYWLPVPDDLNEKLVFNLSYEVPLSYTAIGNGILKKHTTLENSEIWEYQMEKPMSSYLVALAVGKYQNKKLTSTSGIPIELYYENQYSHLVEPTYRHSKEIFDFLEKEIGALYPWEIYKQIPVRDFLYAGMENTGTTIFAESLMTDSIGFTDRNYVSVNAHELAHQWFGNLITQKSSADHWLHEGFATYYALLIEKEIFGEDYFYLKLFEKAELLKSESDKGKGNALTDPKASTLTFYDKGAWAVHILREELGDNEFKKGIRLFLNRYAFQNVSVQEFIATMEESSGKNLDDFVENWLRQSAFQGEEALSSLKKSDFIKEYMEVQSLRKLNYPDKAELLYNILSPKANEHLAKEAVVQLPHEKLDSEAIKAYRRALNHPKFLVRQAVALNLGQIPIELKKDYEKLLTDESYMTREYALANLWSNFPKDRAIYLDLTKNQNGFYDQNIRILWLTLALATPDYQQSQKPNQFNELSQYTGTQYDYSIRQNAFAHLYQLDIFEDQNYLDLLDACTHPTWRFRNFSRELLEELLKSKVHQNKLVGLKNQLSDKEQRILTESLEKTQRK